jgi:hypothetical protein
MKNLIEMADFLSGKNEVELTNELIEKIVKDGFWSDVQSLKEIRDEENVKWNLEKNSLIIYY